MTKLERQLEELKAFWRWSYKVHYNGPGFFDHCVYLKDGTYWSLVAEIQALESEIAVERGGNK